MGTALSTTTAVVDRPAVLPQRRRLGRGAIVLVQSGLFAVALASLLVQLRLVLPPISVGVDFTPLRHATTALFAGRSIYGDRLFVYPPTSVLLLAPLAASSQLGAYELWLVVEFAALVAAALLIGRSAVRGYRFAVACLATIALLGGTVATASMWLGNVSVVLVPAAVYVVLCFERDQWRRGCLVLVASLLLKPLLAPLLLIPALRRQWSPLMIPLVPAVGLLAVSSLVLPGAGRVSTVMRFVISGTNLHGANAVNNLSLRGWGETGHEHAIALLVSALVAGAGIAAVTSWTRRSSGGTGSAGIATVILLSVFLAGDISEVHFLLTIIATGLLQLVLRPSRRATIALLPGLLLLFFLPHDVVGFGRLSGHAVQTLYVGAELLLLGGSMRAAQRAERAEPVGRADRAEPAPAA